MNADTALILSLSKGEGGMKRSSGKRGACLHPALRQAQDEGEGTVMQRLWKGTSACAPFSPHAGRRTL
ncbi:hypothetical protein [Nitratireductor aquibiodomus]|uniref:hypothetical protein n=1 Tax=Nitratireductor aquibiodomus TaxID=204799 RepID=UPI000B25DF38|nr:hypothetical protein [Nitratireductor aquibiodomus]